MTKSALKYIQSLHHKKFRDEHGAFIAEGFKTIAGLLNQNKIICESVYVTEEHIHAAELQQLTNNTNFEIVTFLEMERISLLKEPPGVLGIFKKPEALNPIAEKGIILALDRIGDPGNLGTIIRTADWFGVKSMVCQQGTVELFNPKVVQGSMSSIGNVNVYYTDLEDWLKQFPGNIYTTSIEGNPLASIEPHKDAVIVIGNESTGVSTSIEKLAKFKITISGYGNAESLNAAIATGIILYRFRTI